MRIIYMGTPEFAAIALSAIVKEHEVVAVVTQPDKPQGRNRKLVPTPVKVKAQEYEIPVYQPEFEHRVQTWLRLIQNIKNF